MGSFALRTMVLPVEEALTYYHSFRHGRVLGRNTNPEE